MQRKYKKILVVFLILLMSLGISISTYAAMDTSAASNNEYVSTGAEYIPITSGGALAGKEYCEQYGNYDEHSYLEDHPYQGAKTNAEAIEKFIDTYLGKKSCTYYHDAGDTVAEVRINTVYRTDGMNNTPVNIAYAISKHDTTSRDLALNKDLWSLGWRKEPVMSPPTGCCTEEAKAYGGDKNNKGGFYEKVQDGLNVSGTASNQVMVDIGDSYLIGPFSLTYDYASYGKVHFSGISNMYLTTDGGSQIPVTSIVIGGQVIDDINYYQSDPKLYVHDEAKSGKPTFPEPGEEFYVKVGYDTLKDHTSVLLHAEFKYLKSASASIMAYQAYKVEMVAEWEQKNRIGTYHGHGHHAGCDEGTDPETGEEYHHQDTTTDYRLEVTEDSMYLRLTPISGTKNYSQPLGEIITYKREEGQEKYDFDTPIDITMDIGGEVWSDVHSGKQNGVDGVLTSNDVMLQGVKVTIRGTESGYSRSMVTGADGKWGFSGITADQYNVIFEYNGVVFIAGQYDTDKTKLDTSKAAESGREEFNNKFYSIYGTGADYGEYGNAFNKTGEFTCSLDGSELNLIAFNDVTNKEAIFSATTQNAGALYPQDKQIYINREDKGSQNTSAASKTKTVGGVTYRAIYPYIEHVNLGLIERDKADLSLRKDVYSATITVNEKMLQYKYNSRYAEMEGINQSIDLSSMNTTMKDQMITDKNLINRKNNIIYNRAIYKSDYNYRIDDYKKSSENGTSTGDLIDNNDNATDEMMQAMEKQYQDAGLHITDRELKVFVTYRITVSNESLVDSATINRIVDYFDTSYRLVTQDEYTLIKDGTSEIATKTKIANQPFYVRRNIQDGEAKYTHWEQNAPWDVNTKQVTNYDLNITGDKYSYVEDDKYNVMYTDSLIREVLNPGEKIDLYLTFEVNKATDNQVISDNGDSYTLENAIMLGQKQNLAEIYSYSFYNHDTIMELLGTSTPTQADYDRIKDKIKVYGGQYGITNILNAEGKIDVDSHPGNLVPLSPNALEELRQQKNNGNTELYRKLFEDDADNSPAINITLHDEGNRPDDTERTLTGYVWRDERENKLQIGQDMGKGQIVGNGVYGDEKDKPVNGVTVQLIELVTLPDPNNTGSTKTYEYIWREMSTGNGNFKYVDNHGDVQVSSENGTDNQRKLQNVEVSDGGYKFTSFVSGNFIVRFKYGDKNETVLTNGDKEGKNDISYNGQDYKSTAYQKDQNTVADEWYHFERESINNTDVRISDAKDNEAQRLRVIQYSNTINNHIANVLASHNSTGLDFADEIVKGENSKVANRDALLKELIDNTWMYADTAKINIEVEHSNNKEYIEGASISAADPNYTELSKKNNPTYVVYNMDFGLEERPKTKIILMNDIIQITLITQDDVILMDMRNGPTDGMQIPNPRQQSAYEYYRPDSVKRPDNEMAILPITLFLDNNIMQGAKVTIDYRITILNDSETDTINRAQVDFINNIEGKEIPEISGTASTGTYLGSTYYTGKDEQDTAIVTTTVKKIVDYTDDNLNFRKEDNNTEKHTWDVAKTSVGTDYNILQSGNKESLVNDDITISNITAVMTKDLENEKLQPGQSDKVVLTLSKLISPEDETDDLLYNNISEIVEISNTAGRRDYKAIPGNQDPAQPAAEHDTDVSEKVTIRPSEGQVRYYYVLGIGVAIILIVGIILIKKKVLRK